MFSHAESLLEGSSANASLLMACKGVVVLLLTENQAGRDYSKRWALRAACWLNEVGWLLASDMAVLGTCCNACLTPCQACGTTVIV